MNNIYIIYGDNYKLAYQKRMNIIKDEMVDEYNIDVFDMNKEPLFKAISNAYVMPFLGDKRAVVITNFSMISPKAKVDKDLVVKDDKDSINELLEYASDPMESTVLIIEVPYTSVDSKNEKYNVLFKNSKLIECSYPTIKELANTIDKMLLEEGFEIDNLAREELVNRLEDNIKNYESEISKLIYYKGEDKRISLDDIKNVISESTSAEIYELSKAIIKKDKDKAYLIYRSLLESGFDSFQILGYLVNRFKEFLIVKELVTAKASKIEVANYFKISEGRAYYMINDSKEISYSFLKTILTKLKDLDYNLKVDFKYGDDNLTPFELFFLDI